MLQNITPGQLACIEEIARRIYHQTFPLLTQDRIYFNDRSLVLRKLFSLRVSFRRKVATLVRYHRMMSRFRGTYYLEATIQDQFDVNENPRPLEVVVYTFKHDCLYLAIDHVLTRAKSLF